MQGNGNGHDPEWLALLKAKYKKTPPGKVRGFFEKFATETALDATKAAKLVGYAHPNTQGPKLTKKFPDVAEACGVLWREMCGVKPDELVMHLAEIVRDKDHKDRMKAIITNAQIHGMLSDKLIVDFDRNSLLKQIDARIAQLTDSRAVEVGAALPALPAVITQDDGDST
ncbi:MAG: hypothetical protein GY906_24530 [bacterium]|nr:hypothetical protein [bacterium]